MSKKLIIIVAVVVLLAAGGGGYYYYYTTTLVATDGAEEPPEPETLGMIELEPFLTNINDSSGRRHARVSVKLAVSPEERAAEVSGDALAVARLRDQVLTLINSKSLAELTSPEGKTALRREIVAEAAPIVEPGKVKEALFGEFVVQ